MRCEARHSFLAQSSFSGNTVFAEFVSTVVELEIDKDMHADFRDWEWCKV